jgi:hypothetical protein
MKFVLDVTSPTINTVSVEGLLRMKKLFDGAYVKEYSYAYMTLLYEISSYIRFILCLKINFLRFFAKG